MKRNFLFWMMTMFAAACLAFVSCEKPDEPKNDGGNTEKPEEKPDEKDPSFPEAITRTLDANGSYVIELQPNMDWKIELKYDSESVGWFWIQDGNFKVYTVSGKAGDKAAIEVCAGDRTDFDKVRTCTLEMTMGEKTQTIATFTRGTLERTFSLAFCKVEEDESDYYFNDRGDYEYNEPVTGNTPIPLIWNVRTGGDYRRNVTVSANFDWQLKSKPEWLKPFQGGKAGESVAFELEGDPMAYPLDDASGELVFCASTNEDATFVYTVQIPGCGDMFGISGFAAETHANKEGQIFEENMMGEGSYADVETGISGTVLGLGNVKVYTFVYVVENQWSSYWDNSEYNTSWIKADLMDAAEPTVLKEQTLKITVTPNEGDERRACVIAIPEDKAPANDYEFFSDGQNLDEKYKDYVVTYLTQDGIDSEGGGEGSTGIEPISFEMETLYNYTIPEEEATLEEVTEMNIEALAEKYAKYDALNIYDYYPNSTSGTYILTYYPDVMQSMTNLLVPDFDPSNVAYHKSTPENGEEWLSYEMSENKLMVFMSKPAADASRNFGVIQLMISAQRIYYIICLPEL